MICGLTCAWLDLHVVWDVTGSCNRRGLFKPALQIKYGELLLLFSLPSNVQFHSILYEVMKLVIYLRGEENILLCGKQQIDKKNCAEAS
jgi:hypothetical protein